MNRVRSYMLDMVIMLSAVAVVAIYTYGIRAFASITLSIIAAVLTEALAFVVLMKKNPSKLSDLSTIFTGLAIALALPSSAPLWLAPVGAIFAIAVAKIPFGDTTTAPFTPAAVGIGFVTLCYPEQVFTYPNLAIGKLTISMNNKSFIEGTSLAQMLEESKSIGTNILNVLDVFVGRIPGPMGASCLILMIGTFLYLIIRRKNTAIAPLVYILTCAVFAFLFPRILTGRLYSVLMELGAGLLFYCAVFFISDPMVGPTTNRGRALYGFTAGLLTMILRRVGAYEESAIFAIIIMQAIANVFDSLAETIDAFLRLKSKDLRKKKDTDEEEPEAEETALEDTEGEQTTDVLEDDATEAVLSELDPESATTIEEEPSVADEESSVEDAQEIENDEEPQEVEEPTKLSDLSVDELLATITPEGGNSDE